MLFVKKKRNHVMQYVKIELLIFICGHNKKLFFLIEIIQLNFFCYKKFEIKKDNIISYLYSDLNISNVII